MAISLVRPLLTSSNRVLERYSGSSSGMTTRLMAMRSFGFICLRRATRQVASWPSSGSPAVGCSPLVDAAPTTSVSAGTVAPLSGSPSSSQCSSSAFSTFLNVLMRLIISFQSTSSPLNSGPSMHTKRVLPPIVRRQAPHMPVPSTMMVLSETSLGMLYLWASNEENFIITGGPMAMILSTCSRLITSSMPTVTTPFWPYEPSSVMMMTSSL